jgi:Fe-S-cluster-containing hydrogenase component 2
MLCKSCLKVCPQKTENTTEKRTAPARPPHRAGSSQHGGRQGVQVLGKGNHLAAGVDQYTTIEWCVVQFVNICMDFRERKRQEKKLIRATRMGLMSRINPWRVLFIDEKHPAGVVQNDQ